MKRYKTKFQKRINMKTNEMKINDKLNSQVVGWIFKDANIDGNFIFYISR